MAIHELEYRLKVGPFKFGSKLGQEIKADKGISVDERVWEPEITYKSADGKLDIYSYECSGMFVHLIAPNSLQITHWADDNTYGYTQRQGDLLVGEEINQHPDVGRKMHYIPDSV